MRGTPIRVCRALTREMLFFGVDKTALFMYGLISVMIVYVTRFQFPYAFVGVLVFIAFHTVAVWGFKKDPQMLKVLINHFRFKNFYSPVSFARAKNPQKPNVSIPNF